jgi:hypothetical protein
MTNISLTLYTNRFFGAVLRSPIKMGSQWVTNISRLGPFYVCRKYMYCVAFEIRGG